MLSYFCADPKESSGGTFSHQRTGTDEIRGQGAKKKGFRWYPEALLHLMG